MEEKIGEEKYNAKEELEALHAPAPPLRERIQGWVRGFLNGLAKVLVPHPLRIFTRLRESEAQLADALGRLSALQNALTYCADCHGVMFGVDQKNVLELEPGKKSLFCRWCVQKWKARAIQLRRSAHARG